MESDALFIKHLVSVGILNAVGLLVIAFVVKSVFTKLIDTVAAKRIEELKADAANDLEKRRIRATKERAKERADFENTLEASRRKFNEQMASERAAFETYLDTERRAAARDLERFKSELTLAAEVRRQVAQKKVEALLEIVAQGEPLIRKAMNQRPSDDGEISAMQAFGIFMETIRKHGHLFSKDTIDAFHGYSGEMARYSNEWSAKSDYATIEAACKESERFLEIIRFELGVSINSPTAAAQS